MVQDKTTNSYEEGRKLRVLDNKKRFEDLGILSISKSLTEISNPEKKTTPRKIKPKPSNVYMLEPRRSSRARNPVATYRDDVDLQLPSLRKRKKFSSSWASYLARPLEEVKSASYEERAAALKSAEKLQSNLQSDNPSFVKSMVRSHVYSCFWLGLPARFCEVHLPKSTVDVVLETEEGSEYEAVYISKRAGLSGGWRGFALDHKLDDGDAVVFELVEPTRFKVFIVRAHDCLNQSKKPPVPDMDADETQENFTKSQKKKKALPKDPAVPKTKIESADKNENQSKKPPVPDMDADETHENLTKSQKKKKALPKDPAVPETKIKPGDERRRRSSRRKLWRTRAGGVVV